VRELDTVGDIREYLPITQKSWGFKKGDTPSPLDCLSTGRKGGLVMGIDLDDRRIGFLYVLTAIDSDGRGCHHSHMFCFLPPYRNRGIGYLVKQLYMSVALSRGVDRFSLTVDPLLFNNRLNIAALGGAGESFLVNVYGDFSCDYYGETDTDRIEVMTVIDSRRVRSRLSGDFTPPAARDLLNNGRVGLVNHPLTGADGIELPGPVNLRLRKSYLAVRIPSDYLALRDSRDDKGRPAAMETWRQASRKIFDTYLNRRGYIAAEFVSDRDPDGRRLEFYLLVHRSIFSWDRPDAFPPPR
jgi:predicted GNAT superfamily acetyltransferase